MKNCSTYLSMMTNDHDNHDDHDGHDGHDDYDDRDDHDDHGDHGLSCGNTNSRKRRGRWKIENCSTYLSCGQ